jgi:phosphoribosylformimino-5-aminoimidazole carboxamide ribotide isomerase
MEVIPALDLRQGRCVRLYQGDYDKETVFSDDPVAIALKWREAGAKRLHIIDLDGASEGKLCNEAVIERILRASELDIQVGGGIRNMEAMEHLFELGVERVILGTAAIEDPTLVAQACQNFEGIVISIDAQDGYVKTHGWSKDTNFTAIELLDKMTSLGVKLFIYTDISRDGTLTEPNFAAIAELLAHSRLPIIAAGGISSLEHLKRLAELGVEGAIIGQALYTGDIDLREAISGMEDYDTTQVR